MMWNFLSQEYTCKIWKSYLLLFISYDQGKSFLSTDHNNMDNDTPDKDNAKAMTIALQTFVIAN